jgi:ABC-2 type transport system ATP-binding protein
LVGPNGAGKTTLLHLATGLLVPTIGEIRVLGIRPGRRGIAPGVAFVGQDKPLYGHLTVADTLKAGGWLNPDWDKPYAEELVRRGDVPLQAKVKTLSGGQRTRVALALALGRRPRLLLLDEPLADLDPLARTDIMQTLMTTVAETGMSVMLSSHVLSDIDGACDYLVLLRDGAVRLDGDIDEILASHHLLTGPAANLDDLRAYQIIETRTAGRQATVLMHCSTPPALPGWQCAIPTLEELVVSYLRASLPKAVAA